ncbi:uncharacterized protein LOC142340689 [Convolutriloba macropyga]|uniref:uncharacterized protein LOC142340689 n=1 Tax=Convolutriloba macropyga TaxID=536237 RepID=UPI003F51D1EB
MIPPIERFTLKSKRSGTIEQPRKSFSVFVGGLSLTDTLFYLQPTVSFQTVKSWTSFDGLEEKAIQLRVQRLSVQDWQSSGMGAKTRGSGNFNIFARVCPCWRLHQKSEHNLPKHYSSRHLSSGILSL